MNYTQTSFQRTMGPSGGISSSGGGTKILGISGGGRGGGGNLPSYTKKTQVAKDMFSEKMAKRDVDERLNPILREERALFERVAENLRANRERAESQREQFFSNPLQAAQGILPGTERGEAAWRWDQAQKGTPQGKMFLSQAAVGLDPNSAEFKQYSQMSQRKTPQRMF